MKENYRSRRERLPRRKHQLTKSTISDDDDDDDSEFEHQTFQQKALVRSNKNTNRMSTTLFNPISIVPVEEKQHHHHQTLHISSDQSSLFLYSINSIQKQTAISDDLTPLTVTTTNTTPLTALTCSNTKQIETVKIDLTELSSTDTFNSSSINNNHDQSLSLNRKISLPNLNNKMKNFKDLTQAYDTDTSMRSITFSKNISLEEELSYQKHASCFTIPNIENRDMITVTSSSRMQDISLPTTINTNLNICQHTFVKWNPSRWNLQNMTSKFKLMIGCSSLSLIAGIIILVIIL
ncbi:unnamed protein product [Adineta steineri]|uniref:Uncharacterized protein n=1 Tax=Adineta steineri TaxID=433720 RepID=A0A813Z627_9BILA|nr:unnamed protein product [Adineta steineri]CAF3681434.1 unnamed protein product [Adineta steineri]